MKVTILWSGLASYTVAFFRELASSQGCEIQLIFYGPTSEAPYECFDLSFCKTAIDRTNRATVDIKDVVIKFSPDCILMSSWNFSDYMKIAKTMRSKGVFVVSTMDHQWQGTLRQWVGVISSRWFLKPSIDCFLVPGDRQAYFARKLGYHKILYGMFAATVEEFYAGVPIGERDSSFLYVGRLSPEKGIENLLVAYEMYRQQCTAPWELKIAGTGNLKTLTVNRPGVKVFGFVQPRQLPKLMQSARALILPSLWEPWGVVIHEAAAAGLPVIATYNCGAVPAFVRDGINGFVVQPSPHDLKDAMLKLSSYETERLQNLGKASETLAGLWTPSKLAKYFVENLRYALKG